MNIQVQIPDEVVEATVRGIMENFPEASHGSSLVCVRWWYPEWNFKFVDSETLKEYVLNKAKLIEAFPLIFTDKWPKGCTRPIISASAEEWDSWLCQCDAIDFDAFVQLVCLGEVIYG